MGHRNKRYRVLPPKIPLPLLHVARKRLVGNQNPAPGGEGTNQPLELPKLHSERSHSSDNIPAETVNAADVSRGAALISSFFTSISSRSNSAHLRRETTLLGRVMDVVPDLVVTSVGDFISSVVETLGMENLVIEVVDVAYGLTSHWETEPTPNTCQDDLASDTGFTPKVIQNSAIQASSQLPATAETHNIQSSSVVTFLVDGDTSIIELVENDPIRQTAIVDEPTLFTPTLIAVDGEPDLVNLPHSSIAGVVESIKDNLAEQQRILFKSPLIARRFAKYGMNILVGRMWPKSTGFFKHYSQSLKPPSQPTDIFPLDEWQDDKDGRVPPVISDVDGAVNTGEVGTNSGDGCSIGSFIVRDEEQDNIFVDLNYSCVKITFAEFKIPPLTNFLGEISGSSEDSIVSNDSNYTDSLFTNGSVGLPSADNLFEGVMVVGNPEPEVEGVNLSISDSVSISVNTTTPLSKETEIVIISKLKPAIEHIDLFVPDAMSTPRKPRLNADCRAKDVMSVNKSSSVKVPADHILPPTPLSIQGRTWSKSHSATQPLRLDVPIGVLATFQPSLIRSHLSKNDHSHKQTKPEVETIIADPVAVIFTHPPTPCSIGACPIKRIQPLVDSICFGIPDAISTPTKHRPTIDTSLKEPWPMIEPIDFGIPNAISTPIKRDHRIELHHGYLTPSQKIGDRLVHLTYSSLRADADLEANFYGDDVFTIPTNPDYPSGFDIDEVLHMPGGYPIEKPGCSSKGWIDQPSLLRRISLFLLGW